jgi:ubiquinone/menaquinone biosynthesis C-methylase UbiE
MATNMALYDALAAEYEHGMARVTGLHAADIVDALSLSPGARVLDVAAGTGAITEVLSDRVGADGVVVAADVSVGMLTFARRRLASRSNLCCVLGAGESLPFADGAFDAVACAFGIQHMVDADLALRSMRRVLRPGGRCAIAVWDAVGRDIKTPINEAFAALNETQSLSTVQDMWSAAGALTRRFEGAGFCQIEMRASSGGLSVAGLDDWWQAVTSGRLGDRLRAEGAVQVNRIRDDAYRRAERFGARDGTGWRFPSAALVGVGVAS